MTEQALRFIALYWTALPLVGIPAALVILRGVWEMEQVRRANGHNGALKLLLRHLLLVLGGSLLFLTWMLLLGIGVLSDAAWRAPVHTWGLLTLATLFVGYLIFTWQIYRKLGEPTAELAPLEQDRRQ